MSVAEALQEEIKRVRDDVIPAYREIGVSGAFALAWMTAAIDRGVKALADGDAVACVQAYNELKDAHT